MFCTKCGTENKGDAKFCRSCGNALKAAEAPATAPAGPATPTQPAAPTGPTVQPAAPATPQVNLPPDLGKWLGIGAAALVALFVLVKVIGMLGPSPEFKKAKTQMDAGNYGMAAGLLRTELRNHADNADAKFALAECELRLCQVSQGVETVKELVFKNPKLKPKLKKLYLEAGSAALAKDEVYCARQIYSQLSDEADKAEAAKVLIAKGLKTAKDVPQFRKADQYFQLAVGLSEATKAEVAQHCAELAQKRKAAGFAAEARQFAYGAYRYDPQTYRNLTQDYR